MADSKGRTGSGPVTLSRSDDAEVEKCVYSGLILHGLEIPLTEIAWEISSCYLAAVECGSKARCVREIHTDSLFSFRD